VSHRIRSHPKGRQGHDALGMAPSYGGAVHVTREERRSIADAKRSELFDLFALAVREAMSARIPADMGRFYIGFFKKAVPYQPNVIPQSFRDVCGEDVRSWIAQGIAAVVDTEGYLRTFIPAALIMPPQLEVMPARDGGASGDNPWRRTRHGAYAAWQGSFSEYLNSIPNKARFGRGTLY